MRPFFIFERATCAQFFVTADLGVLSTDAQGVASLAITPLPAVAGDDADYAAARFRDLRLALEATTPNGDFLYTELTDVAALDPEFGVESDVPVDASAVIRPDHVATAVGAPTLPRAATTPPMRTDTRLEGLRVLCRADRDAARVPGARGAGAGRHVHARRRPVHRLV